MIELGQKRAAVIGLGESGLAMARWLARNGATVQVFDDRAEPPGLAALREAVPAATFACRPLGLSYTTLFLMLNTSDTIILTLY